MRSAAAACSHGCHPPAISPLTPLLLPTGGAAVELLHFGGLRGWVIRRFGGQRGFVVLNTLFNAMFVFVLLGTLNMARVVAKVAELRGGSVAEVLSPVCRCSSGALCSVRADGVCVLMRAEGNVRVDIVAFRNQRFPPAP